MTGESGSLWQITKTLSLTAISVLLVDFVFSGAKTTLGDSANQYSHFAYLTILYFCVGAFSAAHLYKGQQGIPVLLGILGACFAGLLLIRLVLTNLFLQKAIAGLDIEDVILLLLKNAAIAGFVIGTALVIFVFVYRATEAELNRAHTTDPETRTDAKGKQVSVTAACSNCNQRTEIEKSGFFGKTKSCFCRHCKSYIAGNPLKEIVSGLAMIVFCIFSIIAVGGMVSASPKGSPGLSIAVLFLLAGLVYGGRLAVAGLIGYVKNRRMPEEGNTVGTAMYSAHRELEIQKSSETKLLGVAKPGLLFVGGTLLVFFLVGLMIKPAMDRIDNPPIAPVASVARVASVAPLAVKVVTVEFASGDVFEVDGIPSEALIAELRRSHIERTMDRIDNPVKASTVKFTSGHVIKFHGLPSAADIAEVQVRIAGGRF